MIDIKTKIITFTLLIITAISQANAQQPTQDSVANDIKYLESSFGKNYDSILTFYFNKRNTEHISALLPRRNGAICNIRRDTGLRFIPPTK